MVASLIALGSRNPAHFDAALVGYTFAVPFATFGITIDIRSACSEVNSLPQAPALNVSFRIVRMFPIVSGRNQEVNGTSKFQ